MLEIFFINKCHRFVLFCIVTEMINNGSPLCDLQTLVRSTYAPVRVRVECAKMQMLHLHTRVQRLDMA